MNVLLSRLRPIICAPLFWLAVVYLAVGVIYAWVTPALEKIDEHWHYTNIVYMREHHTLPPLTSTGWLRESIQPPLYYVVTTVLSAWLPDDPDMEKALGTNPYMTSSVPVYRNDNRNVFLHPPDMTPLILAGRLVSLMFGLGTMIAAYFLAAPLFPRSRLVPIATAALVGFQPNFWFIATAVNNDAATIFLGTVALALVMRRLRRGDWRWFSPWMGVVLGLGLVTKVNSGIYFVLVGLALLIIHGGLRKEFFRDVVIIGIVAFVIGSWWYIRNAVLYHDPLALGTFTSRPNTGYTWDKLRRDLLAIERTYWANEARTFISLIGLDTLLIWWGRIGFVLGALGCVLRPRSVRANLPALLILLSWPVTFMALLIGYWNQKGSFAMGRLLFPAIAPLCLLFVLSWRSVFPERWRRLAVILSTGTVMVTGILIPFVSIYPLFHPSREWNAAQVEHPVEITYMDPSGAPIARLIGYNLSEPYAVPGTYTPVELCWEPLGRTAVPYTLFVHLLDTSRMDANGEPGVWGLRETYPGLGNRPTDRWALHKAFCDMVYVSVFPETLTPLGAALEVGFIDPNRQNRLQAVDKQGDPVDLATVGGVSVLSPPDLPLPNRLPSEYLVNDAISLSDAQVDVSSSITLTLVWQSYKPVSYDATVFVHLVGKDGALLAQLDRPPLGGRFPTSYWRPGQVITDVLSLPLPQSSRPLALNVGMYIWPTMQRLAVKDASGQPVRNDAIVIDVPPR